MSLSTLSVELKLEIARYLSLRDLIILRSVSKLWQTLINCNDSFFHPARISLLHLWEETIRSPCFLPSRREILPRLRSFDRHAYLQSIPEEYALPAEFELWIREWPEKAVVGWLWPGLPEGPFVPDIPENCIHVGDNQALDPDYWWRQTGLNCLAQRPDDSDGPRLFFLRYVEYPTWSSYTAVEMKVPPANVHPSVFDRFPGVGLPVWAPALPDTQCPECQEFFILVIADGGGKCAGTLLEGRSVEVYDIDLGTGGWTGQYGDEPTYPATLECQRELGYRKDVRCLSWIKFLRWQLWKLDEQYHEYMKTGLAFLDWEDYEDWEGWEEWRYRVIDLENQPYNRLKRTPWCDWWRFGRWFERFAQSNVQLIFTRKEDTHNQKS